MSTEKKVEIVTTEKIQVIPGGKTSEEFRSDVEELRQEVNPNKEVTQEKSVTTETTTKSTT